MRQILRYVSGGVIILFFLILGIGGAIEVIKVPPKHAQIMADDAGEVYHSPIHFYVDGPSSQSQNLRLTSYDA